jgi:hypothetical protein
MIHAVHYLKVLHRNRFMSPFPVYNPSNNGLHCKRPVVSYSPKHRYLNPGIFTLWGSHVGEWASLACRGGSSERDLHVTMNDSSVGSRLAAADSPSETGQAALEVSQCTSPNFSPRPAQTSAKINNIATSKPLDQSTHHQFHQRQPRRSIFHQISRRIISRNIRALSTSLSCVSIASCVVPNPLLSADRGGIDRSPARHRSGRYGCYTQENNQQRW